jgi:hypothetical protein
MAISFTKEEKSLKPHLITTKIFWVLLGILISLLFIWGILSLYNKILDNQIKNTKLAIQEIDSKKDLNLEKEMKETLTNYEKISSLLSFHTNPRKILDFLEQNSSPQIKISNINYNSQEKSVSFSISSSSIEFIKAQRDSLLSKKDFVSSVEVSGLSYSGGNISASVKIILNPNAINF